MSSIRRAASRAYDHHRGAAPLLRRTSTLRGVFFVAANLIGFLAVNAFLHYLTTGRWLDVSPAGYRKSLVTPLSAMLVRPLSVFSHPWMLVVAGLLLAAVVFVPIILAVLYRLWVSGVFVLAVAVIGHCPLLAAFLAGGCLLAGRTRLRSNVPFLALLAGLAPMAAYLGFFARAGGILLSPLQWFVLYMLLITAMVVVMLAGAAVLALASVTRFRPGVVWPVLLVFLAAPVWLFYQKVGSAELDYALLAGGLQRSDALFRPGRLEDSLRSATTSPASGPAAAALEAANAQLHRRGAFLLARCDEFLRRHPGNPRGPAVMWIRAVVGDVRIDPRGLRGGRLEYATRSPSKVSIGYWSELADRFRGSPQAMVADQRLGIDALRDGRVEKAFEDLNIAKSLLVRHPGASGAKTSASVWTRVFIPLESLPGEEYYREALAETEKVLWLIDENKVVEGGQANAEAFADYMKLWPFKDLSAHALAEFAASSRGTELEDNYRLLEALAEKHDLRRAEKLSPLTAELKDAAIMAHFELGRLALRWGGSPGWDVRQFKSAEYYFGVVRRAPPNPYKAPAEQHLAMLAARKNPSR